jgi:ABC-type multidrug transport system ATPase subunit
MIACEHLSCGPRSDPPPVAGVHDVTLRIGPGEIVGLVGSPRSGPSALLRALGGLVAPTTGRVLVGGHDPHDPRVRGWVGYVRAGLVGLAELTVSEWLRYVADHRGGRAAARALRAQAAIALVGLGGEADRRLGLLDRDAAERLALATGAVGASSVVLLDDCFAGVHAETRRVLGDALLDLAMQGRAVGLAPREVLAVEDVVTRVVVLRDGRVLANLAMTALQQERTAELLLSGGGLEAVPRLLAHFPDAQRTGVGIAIPLVRGRTLEGVLALCRRDRIPVQGSHVRYRVVDDLLGPAPRVPDPARAEALR